MPQDKKTEIHPYAWVILVVAFLGSVAGSIMMNKVSPMMPALMGAFQTDLAQTGSLVAVFGLTALLLTIPSGLLMQRLGLKITGLIAIGAIIAGSAMGALSNSFGLLMISRAVEGAGFALISVLTPAAIANWFPPDKSGMPMGIWNTSVPVGGVIAMTVAPLIEPGSGWSGVWWASAGFALLALLFWFLIRPVPSKQEQDLDQSADTAHSIYSNKQLWLLGMAMLLYVLTFLPLVTYYPTFLNSERGLTVAQAGLILSIISITTIPGSPLAGWLSDKLGTRRWIMIAGFALLVPLIGLVFQLPAGVIPVVMVLLGLAASATTTTIFAAAPEVVNDPRLTGMSMAMITLCMNLGMVITPPLFGALVERAGWVTAGYAFAFAPILGVVTVFLNKKLR